MASQLLVKRCVKPLNLPHELDRPCLIYHNNKIFILGSNNNIRSWSFDCTQHIYKEIAPLLITPRGRSYAFFRNNNNNIVVIGCKMDKYPYSSSFCIEYFIDSNKWIKHSFRHKHGYDFCAVQMNDFLIISGGINETTNTLFHGNDDPQFRYSGQLSLIKINNNKFDILDTSNAYFAAHAITIDRKNQNEIIVFHDCMSNVIGRNVLSLMIKNDKFEYKNMDKYPYNTQDDYIKLNKNHSNVCGQGIGAFKCIKGFCYINDDKNENFIVCGSNNGGTDIIYYNYKEQKWNLSKCKLNDKYPAKFNYSCISMIIQTNNNKIHIIGGRYHYIFNDYINNINQVNIEIDEKEKEKDDNNDDNDEKEEKQEMQNDNNNKNDIKHWNNNKVCQWITDLGGSKFKEIATIFCEFGVNGEDLIHLNDKQLESMGIKIEFIKAKLLREIKKLIR